MLKQSLKVRIRKLVPEAVIPKYATLGAAGFDLVSTEYVKILPGETKLVKTGLSIEVPGGYELQIRPRSGNSLKTNLVVANAPGTVDSDYRGEICVIVYGRPNFSYTNEEFLEIKKGDRIAQGVIAPIEQVEFEEVTELSETQRGSGGFGSTGK
jgi:dUTP pyrophosphatase